MKFSLKIFYKKINNKVYKSFLQIKFNKNKVSLNYNKVLYNFIVLEKNKQELD